MRKFKTPISTNQQHVVADSMMFVVGMLLVAFTWLIPNHQLPWPSFHHEIWMGLVVAGALLVIGWQTQIRIKIPRLSLILLALACVPFIQYSIGLIPAHGQASIGAIYLLVFALAMVIGLSIAEQKSLVFWKLLFGAMLFAALINVGIQMAQWSGIYDSNYLSLIGFWVTRISDDSRPSGSLLQPNQLATLLVWGLLSLLWLRKNDQIRPWLAVAAAAILLMGIALAQSRTSVVELAVLSLLSLLSARAAERKWLFSVFAMSLLAVILLMALLPLASEVWHGDSMTSRNLAHVSDRLGAYKIFWYALMQSPWLGYGFGNLAGAFLAAASYHPEWYSGVFFIQTHNVLLDMLLWFGIPLGLLLIGYVIFVLRSLLQTSKESVDGFFFFGLVAVLVVHSMVELPHQFLYFLVPLGLCIGRLSRPVYVYSRSPASGKIVWCVLGLTGLLLSIVIANDYLKIQERYTEWRFEKQRIGKPPQLYADDVLLLRQFNDELGAYKVISYRKLTDDQLVWLEKAAQAANTAPIYYSLVVSLALSGKDAETRAWMMKLNAISSRKNWNNIQGFWRRAQTENVALQHFYWPELPPGRR